MDLIQQTCSELIKRDAAQIENIIQTAINAAIGSDWVIDDLVGRLTRVRVCDEPQETFFIDGKPVLELWPTEIECEGLKIKTTRKYRYLIDYE